MKEQLLNANVIATIGNNRYQYIPIEDMYAIFCEKLRDEGIKPPTFEEYKNRK